MDGLKNFGKMLEKSRVLEKRLGSWIIYLTLVIGIVDFILFYGISTVFMAVSTFVLICWA